MQGNAAGAGLNAVNSGGGGAMAFNSITEVCSPTPRIRWYILTTYTGIIPVKTCFPRMPSCNKAPWLCLSTFRDVKSIEVENKLSDLLSKSNGLFLLIRRFSTFTHFLPWFPDWIFIKCVSLPIKVVHFAKCKFFLLNFCDLFANIFFAARVDRFVKRFARLHPGRTPQKVELETARQVFGRLSQLGVWSLLQIDKNVRYRTDAFS